MYAIRSYYAVLNISTRKSHNAEPGVRESLVIASLGWVILALVGSFPYLVTGSVPHFVDAYFESMSGFTTTGSSILTDIEALPKSILFWRSLTHWIGGMGIIVLVIAIMPFLKITGTQLFSSEASVVVEEKISTNRITSYNVCYTKLLRGSRIPYLLQVRRKLLRGNG